MATKTTGAEFKRFYADPKFWPPENGVADANVWHEDVCITVNGEDWSEDHDLMEMPDNASVAVEGGAVMCLQWEEAIAFETHFKRWRKKQNTVSFVVECDKDKVELVKAAVKTAGGKVV